MHNSCSILLCHFRPDTFWSGRICQWDWIIIGQPCSLLRFWNDFPRPNARFDFKVSLIEDAAQEILALGIIATLNSSVFVKSGKLSWRPARCHFSRLQMYVNERAVFTVHTEKKCPYHITMGWDQAFSCWTSVVVWKPPRLCSFLLVIRASSRPRGHPSFLLRLGCLPSYCIVLEVPYTSK